MASEAEVLKGAKDLINKMLTAKASEWLYSSSFINYVGQLHRRIERGGK
jgi:hypothetical protein